MTPRPRRVAVRFAASLLTTTAGRRLLAPEPRAGSRSTALMSPRLIGHHPVAGGPIPQPRLVGGGPFLPCGLVRDAQFCPAKHSNCLVHGGRSRVKSLLLGVRVQELDILVWQADTHFHTASLPM